MWEGYEVFMTDAVKMHYDIKPVTYDFDPDDTEELYVGDVEPSTIKLMGTEGYWCSAGKTYHQMTKPWLLRNALVSEKGMVRLAMEMFEMCMIEARHLEPQWVEVDQYSLYHHDPDDNSYYVQYLAPPEVDDVCTYSEHDVDECPSKIWYTAAHKAMDLVNNHFGKRYIR